MSDDDNIIRPDFGAAPRAVQAATRIDDTDARSLASSAIDYAEGDFAGAGRLLKHALAITEERGLVQKAQRMLDRPETTPGPGVA